MNEPTNKEESHKRAKKKKEGRKKSNKGMTNIRKERDSCGRWSNRRTKVDRERENEQPHFEVHLCYASHA